MSMLGYEIGHLIGEIDENVRNHRDMPVNEQRLLVTRLMTLGRLAGNIETELEVHRLAEAGKSVTSLLDKAATDTLTHLVRDPDGTILRPDFGRKS